jgi:hypothetical protein
MTRMLPMPVHVYPAYASCRWSPYVATIHESSTELSRATAPDTIPITPADRSTGPYPVSLPSQPMKQWEQSQASINGRLLGLLGPYHQHAIGTFNTCSRGPTHRSVTDRCGGYNRKGAVFSHTTPRPSQPAVFPFHLRALPGLRLSIHLTTIWTGGRSGPKSCEWEPPLDFYHNLSSKHSMS